MHASLPVCVPVRVPAMFELEAGGKPSTWFPPGKLVELFRRETTIIIFSRLYMSVYLCVRLHGARRTTENRANRFTVCKKCNVFRSRHFMCRRLILLNKRLVPVKSFFFMCFCFFSEKNKWAQKSATKHPSTRKSNSNRILFIWFEWICYVFSTDNLSRYRKINCFKKKLFARKIGTIPSWFLDLWFLDPADLFI